MKQTKRLLLLGPALLLLIVVVGHASAAPPRVTWDPKPLVTEDLEQGDEATYAVTLSTTGYLPIPAAHQLRIEAEGAIAPYITIDQPKFPNSLKKGQCGLARPRFLAGGTPARVIASHEPGIEPCGATGNRRVDA